MDRYLRYSLDFEGGMYGTTPPSLVFTNILYNPDNHIIGLRFVDRSFPMQNVFIDIPINNFFTKETDDEKIKKYINEFVSHNVVKVFDFYKGASTSLRFVRGLSKGKITLRDNFRFLKNRPDITSIYLPKCIIRYADKRFHDIIPENLAFVMNTIFKTDFIDVFKVFHMQYVKFINNNYKISIYLKSRSIDKFMTDPGEFKAMADSFIKYHCLGENIEIKLDTVRKLILLETAPTICSYESSLTKYVPVFSEIGKHKLWKNTRIGIKENLGSFYAFPDGGNNLFEINPIFLSYSEKNELSRNSKDFITKTTDMNFAIMYDFAITNPDEIELYIGFAPNVSDSLVKHIYRQIEGCINSKNMELLQTLIGEKTDESVSIGYEKGKILCKGTLEFDTDLYAFGREKREEILKTITEEFTKYFDKPNIESNVQCLRDVNLLAFSITINVKSS